MILKQTSACCQSTLDWPGRYVIYRNSNGSQPSRPFVFYFSCSASRSGMNQRGPACTPQAEVQNRVPSCSVAASSYPQYVLGPGPTRFKAKDLFRPQPQKIHCCLPPTFRFLPFLPSLLSNKPPAHHLFLPSPPPQQASLPSLSHTAGQSFMRSVQSGTSASIYSMSDSILLLPSMHAP